VRKDFLVLTLLVFMTTACVSGQSPDIHLEKTSAAASMQEPEGGELETPLKHQTQKIEPSESSPPQAETLPENGTQNSEETASPTNSGTKTNTPESQETTYPQPWMNMPVVPEVSETAKEIYQRGLESGKHPGHFSKVGDCQSEHLLAVFDYTDWYSLGETYNHLQPTIDHFQGSFRRDSLAVGGGKNVATVLSPLHANQAMCFPNETPLACELRVHKPSMAIISFEEWWSEKPAEVYEGHLRTIVEYAISQGTVPILATKADNVEGDHSINKAIVEVAKEYDVPLWNFWRAAHPLPNHGLYYEEEWGWFHLTYGGGEHIHFEGPGGDCNHFDDPTCLQYAWPWRNLTALQSINAVWRDAQN